MTAILFARSLHRLATLDAGFKPENVLLLSMTAKGFAADESVRVYARVLDRLQRTPGVVSAALSSENLLSGNAWTEPITVPGEEPRPGKRRRGAAGRISGVLQDDGHTPAARAGLRSS
jgi:hypothetical protein